MAKLDLKKTLKEQYKAKQGKYDLLQVPEQQYLMHDGKGDPNTSEEFQKALEALYGVAYKIKFQIKNNDAEKDFVVMPLEGLWWCDDMNSFSMDDKKNWKWTLMILMPDYVTKAHYETAKEEITKNKGIDTSKVRLEKIHEGMSLQTMHIGPYADEATTMDEFHKFMKENGYAFRDRHHEIYLGDPRKTAPEKLKTIIRQPVTMEKV